jgi:hypothetical protein
MTTTTAAATDVPFVDWDLVGCITATNGPHHTARTSFRVSADGAICMTVEQSICGDDPDGPEVLLTVKAAERLHAVLDSALQLAKARSTKAGT